MELRCVIDVSRNCPMNMAIDEMFFTKSDFVPVFRFYQWTEPSYSIGYFQKISDIKNENKYPITRRMTAGLAVLHDYDLSYSLIISDDLWKHIYNQEETYKIVHNEIKKALSAIGITCDNVTNPDTAHKDISCVKTFYKDDVFLNGKKLVGSCQRRRGRKILVQGSIHIKLTQEQINIFANKIFMNISDFLNCSRYIKPITDQETHDAGIIAQTKYASDKWNKLF